MASLTIRKLPDDLKQELREMAARSGRSVEEEARCAIRSHVRSIRKPRKGIFELIHDASRPGLDLPEVADSPASFATFDE
jgi:plasmid stability protein